MNCCSLNNFPIAHKIKYQKLTAACALISAVALCFLALQAGGLHFSLGAVWAKAAIPFCLISTIFLISLASFAVVSCLKKESIDITNWNKNIQTVVCSYITPFEPSPEFFELCDLANRIGEKIEDGFSGNDPFERIFFWLSLPVQKKMDILFAMIEHFEAKALPFAVCLLLKDVQTQSELYSHQLLEALFNANHLEALKVYLNAVPDAAPQYYSMRHTNASQALVVEYLRHLKKKLTGKETLPRGDFYNDFPLFIEWGWVMALKEIFYCNGNKDEFFVMVAKIRDAIHLVIIGALHKQERGYLLTEKVRSPYLRRVDEGDHEATIKLLLEMGIPKARHELAKNFPAIWQLLES